ncbi:unnamed protein product [Colias eurytheme]|nr:unnamed protein product [Colias eurytheme]
MEKIKNKSNQSRKVKFNFEPTDNTLYPEPLSDKKKINKATKKQKQTHAFKKPFPTNTEENYKEEYLKNKEEKDVSPDMKHFLSRIGAGDQILKVKKKCSNVILGFLNHKKHYIEKQPPPAPLFAVKVDSSNFQVLNSAEIKRKVKAMGNVAKMRHVGTDDWNTARRTYNPNRRRALQLGPNINQYGGVRRNLENNTNVECMCNCECDKKSVKKNKKKKVKRKPLAKKHPVAKRTSIFKKENMSKKFHQQEKKFSKLKKKRAKEQRKKEKEEQRKKIKLQKEIEKLAMKETNNTNFLGNFVNGVLNLTLQTVRRFFTVIVSIIFDPINSYLYTKDKVTNPLDSAKSFKRWIVDTWKSKDSKFYKTIADSNAINVLADHLEDSAVFQTFTNKGRTQVERKIYERKFKSRKKRMRKRHDAALYGCRHMLLTTLRKHPCLWGRKIGKDWKLHRTNGDLHSWQYMDIKPS